MLLLAETGVSMGHDEVGRLWRIRLQDAALRLDFARSYVAEVRQADAAEYETAMRAESVARTDYLRVLRAFTDLVLAGIIPD